MATVAMDELGQSDAGSCRWNPGVPRGIIVGDHICAAEEAATRARARGSVCPRAVAQRYRALEAKDENRHRPAQPDRG